MEEAQLFRVTGLDCADCAKTVESGVGKLAGVQACTLNYSAALLRVEGTTGQAEIVARIRQLGYDVQADETSAASQTPAGLAAYLPANGALGFVRFLLQRRTTTLALLGGILILPGLLFNELLPMLHLTSPWLDAFSLLALLVAGLPIAQSAWRTLTINRQLSINLLMTIAAVGAVILGAYTEAGLVMVLFAVGEALEGYTMAQARSALRQLLAVAPDEATVLRPCLDCQGHLGQDGYSGGPCPFCGVEEQRVPVAALQLGEIILVKPGERIAMDGQVHKGVSTVNQAPITGESVPVTKTPGIAVFAGTINGEGALEVTVTRRVADNTISRIIRLVEEAQERKSPAERFVDRFARWYTPLIVASATLLATLPPLLWGAPFWGEQGWLYRALELLVIACPCALVISTPVSIVSAISNAARNGILIKGGAYLEALSKIRAIAFDKTGTLTEGRPAVVKVRAVDCTSHEADCLPCANLLTLASAVERRSEHPLAQAIVRAPIQAAAATRYPAAENVSALVGKGVSGQVNGRQVLIGSHQHFDSQIPHELAVCEEISQVASQGWTPLLVSEAGQYKGYIAVADTLRQSSQAALTRLQQIGIAATVMLTGDQQATAQSIGQQAGVTLVRAELLPEQKVTAVQELLAKYGHVAMVGDGVNDAPALATATVGIAMGAGTAQAIETADITLMGNDLSKLPFALQLSRAAMRTIQHNITAAIGVKGCFLLLALLGLGNLWLAVLADVGTALLVTLHGMQLLRFKTESF